MLKNIVKMQHLGSNKLATKPFSGYSSFITANMMHIVWTQKRWNSWMTFLVSLFQAPREGPKLGGGGGGGARGVYKKISHRGSIKFQKSHSFCWVITNNFQFLGGVHPPTPPHFCGCWSIPTSNVPKG